MGSGSTELRTSDYFSRLLGGGDAAAGAAAAEAAAAEAKERDGVTLRDAEHAHYYRAFLVAFPGVGVEEVQADPGLKAPGVKV